MTTRKGLFTRSTTRGSRTSTLDIFNFEVVSEAHRVNEMGTGRTVAIVAFVGVSVATGAVDLTRLVARWWYCAAGKRWNEDLGTTATPELVCDDIGA